MPTSPSLLRWRLTPSPPRSPRTRRLKVACRATCAVKRQTSCGSSLKSTLTLALLELKVSPKTRQPQACGPTLSAFRIWTWSSQLSKWLLYIVGPPRARKQQNCTNPAVIWLRLCNQHYTWFKPMGNDWALDRLVPNQAVRAYEDPTPPALNSDDPLAGAGKANSVSSSSCRRLLGLVKPSSASTKGSSKASTAEALKSVKTTSASAASASKPHSKPALSSARAASVAGSTMAELLGLTAAQRPKKQLSPEDFRDEPYRVGDLFHCPCGRKPRNLENRSAVRRNAQTHWKACQGTAPPSAASHLVRRRVALTNMLDPETRRRLALQSYNKFVAGLKAKKWQASACVPVEDVPFVVCASSQVAHTSTPSTPASVVVALPPCKSSAGPLAS